MAKPLSGKESLSLDSGPMVIPGTASSSSVVSMVDTRPMVGQESASDVWFREFLYGTKKSKTQDGYLKCNDPLAVEISKDPSAILHKSVANCQDELKKVQDEHDGFQSQYYDEIYKIEANYLREIRPLCFKRMRLVYEGENVEARKLPRFWLSVMRAADDKLNMEIRKRDEEALSYLKDIKYTILDYTWSWKIEFVFDPNPYFENRVLTKEVRYSWSRGKRQTEVAKGTDINWYPGKCLTQKVVQKMSKRVMVKYRSFFNSFMESEDFLYNNEPRQFCETFTKWIIPNALSIFLGCSNMDADQSLVQEFNELQKQFDACKLKMSEDKLAAEDVYLKNVGPLHKMRGNLIADHHLVAEVLPSGEEYLDGIPEFWLHAMKGEKYLSPMISADDAKVLRYLKDIKFSRLVGCSGWKHEFFFNPNPYFKNSVLTKTIHTRDYKWTVDVEKSIGTVIEWSPGSLFANVERHVKSFFNLFNESVEDLRRHHLICNMIRARIIPHAASLYLEKHIDDSLRRAVREYYNSQAAAIIS